MNKSAKPNIKEKLTYQPYFVCLIDILGQKDVLRKMPILTTDSKITQEDIITQLTATVGKVIKFREYFTKAKDLFTQQFKFNDFNITSQQKNIINDIFKSKISYTTFSDTIVIYLPVQDIEEAPSILDVYRFLIIICFTVLSCHAYGIPVRGGINIGAGVELSENEFYGAGLEKAHALEQHFADYPRILIGIEAINYIDQLVRLNSDDNTDELKKDYAELISTIINQDNDNLFILDYMNKNIYEAVKAINASTKFFSMCYDFAKGEHIKFYQNGNIKLASKYGRLLSYYESRKNLWLS